MIERITDQSREPIDLSALAARPSPPGVLAQAILEIDDADHPELLNHIRRALQQAFHSQSWPHTVDLPSHDTATPAVKQHVRSQAQLLLERLLEQNSGGPQ